MNEIVETYIKYYKNEPINFSFSFMSSWESCEFKAFLDYVVKIYWIEEDTRNFIVGTVFHNLFEEYYRIGKFDKKWLYDNYVKYFEEEVKKKKCICWYNGDEKTDRKRLIDKLKNLIDNQLYIIKKYDLKEGDYLVEEKFEITENNFNIKFKGYIDLLYDNKDKLYILDYKTQNKRDIVIEQLLIYYFGYVKDISKRYTDRFKDMPDEVGIILPAFKEIIYRKINIKMVKSFMKNKVLPMVKDIRTKLKSGNLECNKRNCLSYGKFCKYRQWCPMWNNNFEELIELNEKNNSNKNLKKYF